MLALLYMFQLSVLYGSSLTLLFLSFTKRGQKKGQDQVVYTYMPDFVARKLSDYVNGLELQVIP